MTRQHSMPYTGVLLERKEALLGREMCGKTRSLPTVLDHHNHGNWTAFTNETGILRGTGLYVEPCIGPSVSDVFKPGVQRRGNFYFER